MTDAELLKSVGLYYSKIAQHIGVSHGTVKNWACYGIPDEQRQAIVDLAEAVRQVIAEHGRDVAQFRNGNSRNGTNTTG